MPRLFRFGEFEVDGVRLELRRCGQLRPLRGTPLRLLLFLLENAGEIIAKERILAAVWPDVQVSETSLATALKEIRQALEDDGAQQRWVRTLRGRGYTFVQPVDVVAPEAARGRRPISGHYRSPSMFFVGRASELEMICGALTDDTPVRPSVSLEAMPGVGKTELALQAVHRFAAAGTFPGGIFWLDAAAADLTGFWGDVVAAQWRVRGASAQERCRAVLSMIEETPARALVVLDNVVSWDAAERPQPLPQGPHVCLLATTQIRNLGSARFRHIPIDVLPEPDDRALVERIARRAFGAELEPLLGHLCGHALALELAGGFLGTYPSESPASYLRELESRAGSPAAPGPLAPEGAFASVWARISDAARDVWWLASFLGPEPGSTRELAEWGLPPDGVRQLESLHILQSDASGAWVMHGLAQSFAQRSYAVGPSALALLIDMAPHLVHRRLMTRELERVYARAAEIADALALHAPLFTALTGMWQIARLRGDWPLSTQVAARMRALLERNPGSDALRRAIALNALGESCFYAGRIEQAWQWLATAEADAAAILDVESPTAFHPAISLLAYGGIVRFLRGEPSAGLACCGESLRLAEEIGRPIDAGMAVTLKGVLHQWRREFDAVAVCGRRLQEIGRVHVFPNFEISGGRFLAMAEIFGSARDLKAQIEQMQRCHAALIDAGLAMGRTATLGLLADACRLVGDRTAGLAWIEQALETASSTGEVFFEPELWRIRAGLVGPGPGADESLERALALAVEQGARWWALRAASDLAAGASHADGRAHGRAVLRELLAQIEPEPGLFDLVRARSLAADGV